jgi:hypothetical protein
MSTSPQDHTMFDFLDADDSSSPAGARAVLAGARLPGGMDATPGGHVDQPGHRRARLHSSWPVHRGASAQLLPAPVTSPPLRLVPLPLRTVRPRLLPAVPGAQPAAPPPRFLSSKHPSSTRMECAHVARMVFGSLLTASTFTRHRCPLCPPPFMPL